ncbi:MLX-interacting protein isoform X2 [Orussus abietinus]|uniref:MLX-interacting protein isoform X2 n=1 Tax=Orussus abietinus TaxID=222816 RepID=UPI0006264E44|nr:MLX-interacting protein isoform X2 [Orussus abietinus]
MQAELMYRKPAMTSSPQRASQGVLRGKQDVRDSKETIHSGHFMVSDFEAEAQDDEDELAVPVPEEEAARLAIIAPVGFSLEKFVADSSAEKSPQQLSIETSLSKLFQCMSLAYRQKLTSPKWNRFKGIRLRWKDKIRLNNVIWRCWHMQFILKQNTLVCQFASPLDVDTHNKPEAVVLEGKYWKRKLAAVTAEYKKWRMFYRNQILGWTNKDGSDMLESMDMLDWDNGMGTSGGFGTGTGSAFGGNNGPTGGDNVHSMMVDEDYMELMTDTLFSTISSNQPIYFPDPREIEFLNSKLPPVPEEDDMFRSSTLNSNYPELDLMTPIHQVNQINEEPPVAIQQQAPQQQQLTTDEQDGSLQNLQYTAKIYTQPESQATGVFRNSVNIGEGFNAVQRYDTASSTPLVREKSRQSRSSTRSSRVIQQPQQQQPPGYQQPAQHQSLNYQEAAEQRTAQSYSMDIQTVQLTQPDSRPQINTLNGQNRVRQIAAASNHVERLTTAVQNYVQSTSVQQQQQRAIRPLPVSSPMAKPYKIVQPQQQGYKFPTPPQPFAPQQYKFNSNDFKSLPAHPVVSADQPQSHILFQCRPQGFDLSAPAQHPTKLLPRPAAPTADKEEVFAVPKYQMKARSRSRSSSSLAAPKMHPPPLVSAVSDPALNLNSNVLFAQLLTNNTSNLYTVSGGPEKVISTANLSSGVKHILPMLPPTPSSAQITNTTRHITTPVAVQPIQTTPVQTQQQQQALQQVSSGQSVLLNANSQAHQPQGSPGSPKDGSAAHSPQGLSLSPLHSPMSLGSPLSPSRGLGKSEPERGQCKEQRRVGHIHAEQKRRYNIKNGFDMLHSLIPQLNQNPNTKLSKAVMLQKGADYIRQLRAERNQLKEEMDSLRHQIECLNTSISNCQSMLPATGAPVSRQRTTKMKEMFDEYVRTRTRENWKFWIFSILLEPLMITFNTSVSTASVEDLYRSTVLWVEQHCSLVDLRPAVLNSLRYLCTATDILSDPGRLPDEALAAVNRSERQRSTQ